jgi:hypothetical protein
LTYPSPLAVRDPRCRSPARPPRPAPGRHQAWPRRSPQVIQLQGDQRRNVSTFLVQQGLVKKEKIKIHGF